MTRFLSLSLSVHSCFCPFASLSLSLSLWQSLAHLAEWLAHLNQHLVEMCFNSLEQCLQESRAMACTSRAMALHISSFKSLMQCFISTKLVQSFSNWHEIENRSLCTLIGYGSGTSPWPDSKPIEFARSFKRKSIQHESRPHLAFPLGEVRLGPIPVDRISFSNALQNEWVLNQARGESPSHSQ